MTKKNNIQNNNILDELKIKIDFLKCKILLSTSKEMMDFYLELAKYINKKRFKEHISTEDIKKIFKNLTMNFKQIEYINNFWTTLKSTMNDDEYKKFAEFEIENYLIKGQKNGDGT